RMSLLVAVEQGDPLRAQPRAAGAETVRETLAHAVGDQELRLLRPAVEALAEADLLVAERLAVGGVAVLLVRRAVADVAVDDDQCRPVRCGFLGLERAIEHGKVVRVADTGHAPAVADEAR